MENKLSTISPDSLWVTIQFRMRGETEWFVHQLSPEEYFDSIESYTQAHSREHPYGIRSVPKYFRAIEYLDGDAQKFEATRLTITDSHRNQMLVQSEIFDHEHHRSLIAQKIQTNQSTSWSFVIEMIHDGDDRISQIIKFGLDDDLPHSFSRVVTRRNDDGTETLLRDD